MIKAKLRFFKYLSPFISRPNFYGFDLTNKNNIFFKPRIRSEIRWNHDAALFIERTFLCTRNIEAKEIANIHVKARFIGNAIIEFFPNNFRICNETTLDIIGYDEVFSEAHTERFSEFGRYTYSPLCI